MADAVFEFLRHFGVRFPLSLVRLEDGVPTKVGRATGGNYFSVGSPVKYEDFFTGTSGVCHNGLGEGRAVVETIQHLVQSRMTTLVQKPFDVGPKEERNRKSETLNKETIVCFTPLSHKQINYAPGQSV